MVQEIQETHEKRRIPKQPKVGDPIGNGETKTGRTSLPCRDGQVAERKLYRR